eukprot:scaffold28077_cov20-Attheya_sp.AAC.1
MEQTAPTSTPATTSSAQTNKKTTTRSGTPQIHKEDRGTNWRRYKSTQVTKKKSVIFEDKIYIIYTGMNGRHSAGLYPSWSIASKYILGYVAVHGTVKKHEAQRAWRQLAEIYPG